MAAAAGRVDMVRMLVERGADVNATDPDFHAPPLRWAEFFDRADVIEELRSL